MDERKTKTKLLIIDQEFRNAERLQQQAQREEEEALVRSWNVRVGHGVVVVWEACWGVRRVAGGEGRREECPRDGPGVG